MISDKEFADQIHILIHSVRLIPNYKPTEFEKKVSKYVLDKYSETCAECKEIKEKLKNQPQKEKGFLGKLGSVITDAGGAIN
jgi:hypothetical protein